MTPEQIREKFATIRRALIDAEAVCEDETYELLTEDMRDALSALAALERWVHDSATYHR